MSYSYTVTRARDIVTCVHKRESINPSVAGISRAAGSPTAASQSRDAVVIATSVDFAGRRHGTTHATRASENVGRFSHASERLRRRSENGFHGGVGAFRTDTTAVRDERGVSVDGVLSDSQQTCRHAQVDRNGSLEMEEPVHIVGARGDNRRLGPDLVSERTD